MFNSATDAWSVTGSLSQLREEQTATLLPDGPGARGGREGPRLPVLSRAVRAVVFLIADALLAVVVFAGVHRYRCALQMPGKQLAVVVKFAAAPRARIECRIMADIRPRRIRARRSWRQGQLPTP